MIRSVERTPPANALIVLRCIMTDNQLFQSLQILNIFFGIHRDAVFHHVVQMLDKHAANHFLNLQVAISSGFETIPCSLCFWWIVVTNLIFNNFKDQLL